MVTLAVTRVSAQGGPTLIVDPSGAGNYTTIQAAVNAVTNAAGPRTILVRAGTYAEAVNISAKNTGATADAQRLVIQADPQAARGTVIVTPPANNNAFHIHQCKFITLDGFTIVGVTGNQMPAVKLGGGAQDNQDVTVSGNDIHGNSSHGIEVQAGNPRTWLINNLIRHNGTPSNTGEGVNIANGTSAQPVYLLNNTIYANRFNGVFCQKPRVLWVVNNLIVGNGTDTDPNNMLNKNGLRRGIGALKHSLKRKQRSPCLTMNALPQRMDLPLVGSNVSQMRSPVVALRQRN